MTKQAKTAAANHPLGGPSPMYEQLELPNMPKPATPATPLPVGKAELLDRNRVEDAYNLIGDALVAMHPTAEYRRDLEDARDILYRLLP